MPSFLVFLSSAAAAAIAGVCAYCIAFAMGIFNSKNHMPVDGKTVLLTGASEGLGLSVARLLSSKGANVVIVSRSIPSMEKALEQIKAAAKDPSTQRFHYISADVSVPDYAQPVFAAVKEWNNSQPPDIVWCLAGWSVPSLFVEMPFSLARTHMNINYFGTAEMCYAALREWLAPDAPSVPGGRHLIVTSTLVSLVNIAGYGSYGASKWALRGLFDALAMEIELYPQDVRLHMVFPGTLLGAAYDREKVTKPEITKMLEKNDPIIESDVAARTAIASIEAGHHMAVSGPQPNMMRWVSLGGSVRNNWIVDTIMGVLVQIAAPFILLDIFRTVRKYGKTHAHPSTYQQTKYEPKN